MHQIQSERSILFFEINVTRLLRPIIISWSCFFKPLELSFGIFKIKQLLISLFIVRFSWICFR